MNALSDDIRMRVLDAYLSGEGSYRELAQRFEVSHSFIQKLVKLHRETGSIRPKGHAGGNPGKIGPEHHGLILELVDEQADAILIDFAELFESRTGIKVSFMTIQRCFQKLDITLKKKRGNRKR